MRFRNVLNCEIVELFQQQEKNPVFLRNWNKNIKKKIIPVKFTIIGSPFVDFIKKLVKSAGYRKISKKNLLLFIKCK